MSIEITVDSIAQSIAQAYLSGQPSQTQERDRLRIVYNVKQIAFNAFTILTGLYALMTLSWCLSPLSGILLTAACFAGRVVVFREIQTSLRNFQLSGAAGQAVKFLNSLGTKASGIEPEDNPILILGYVTRGQNMAINWIPGVKIFGFTVFRNLIPL